MGNRNRKDTEDTWVWNPIIQLGIDFALCMGTTIENKSLVAEQNESTLLNQLHDFLLEYVTAPAMSEIHPNQPRISTTRFMSPTMFLWKTSQSSKSCG